MKLKWLAFGLLLVGMVACAPNPIDIAKADNSRAITAQTAADTEQARQIRAEQWAQTLLVVKASMPTIVFATEFVALALALNLSMSLVGTGAGIGTAGYGLGKVAVRAAEVRANQVHMDTKTRTFPLVLLYVSKGVYTCTNSGTGSTLRLDTRNKADAELVKGINEVTRAGMVAYEVAGHENAEGHADRVSSLVDSFMERVNHAEIPNER